MTTIQAAWICPIDRPPIREGIIDIADGRIAGIRGPGAERGDGSRLPARGARHLGNVAILPGLINAHIHLELSWMRDRVPPAESFSAWVRTLFAVRGRPDAGMSEDQVAAIPKAIADLQASGTVAVGDISNSLRAVGPMLAAGLGGVVFHELLGFKERDGALIEATRELRSSAARTGARISLAPHAPYSTSLELFDAIRAEVDASPYPVMSVHLGESPEESEFLQRGTGPWRGMLEAIGVWRDDWTVPACDPVTYLDRHGVIDARTLVVHGVQFSDAALDRLRQIGATLVTCPRSNRWVGVGDPPVERFYRSGVNVAVGTDSLASVGDLNLFSELSAMRKLAPKVAAARLLESATQTGAEALGLDSDLGTLSVGKQAKMISVRLPDGTADVEEFLVSGITPDRIEPLNL